MLTAKIEFLLFLNSCLFFASTGIAAILYECRLGCLEEKIPQETEDYIDALHLMFSSFKTTMYAGAIPKWLRPIFPKPWEEFCDSWDGLFRFSEWLTLSQCDNNNVGNLHKKNNL